MIANQDPDLSAAVVDKVDTEAYRLLPFRSPTALKVFEYADRQRDQRLAEPADDVLQALTVAQSEGALNEREFHNYFGVLMIAGNETTRHTISHGMLALMQHRSSSSCCESGRADPERHGGDPAVGHPGVPLPAHGHPGRGVARSADRDRATRSSPGTSAPTATRRCSPTRTRSTSRGRRTTT